MNNKSMPDVARFENKFFLIVENSVHVSSTLYEQLISQQIKYDYIICIEQNCIKGFFLTIQKRLILF